MGTDYDYELRQAETIHATGRLTLEQHPELGERIRIGDHDGIIRDVLPALHGQTPRLVIQLLRK